MVKRNQRTRRGPRGGRRGRAPFVTTRTLSRTTNGNEFSPPADPRPVSETPWNTLTYQFDATLSVGGGLVTLELLHIHTNTNIGNSTGSFKNFEYRLIDVEAWNLEQQTTGRIAGLKWAIFDPTQNDSFSDPSILHTKTDYPARMAYARLGFNYPSRVKSFPIRGATTTERALPLVFVEPTDAGMEERVTIRIRYHWRLATVHDIDRLPLIHDLSKLRITPSASK